MKNKSSLLIALLLFSGMLNTPGLKQPVLNLLHVVNVAKLKVNHLDINGRTQPVQKQKNVNDATKLKVSHLDISGKTQHMKHQ